MRKAFTLLLFGMLTAASFAVTPPDSSLIYQWNAPLSRWDTSYFKFDLFDGNGQLQSTRNEPHAGGAYRNSYTYNTGGQMTTRLTENMLMPGQWTITSRSFYTYNAQGMKVSERYENYNGSSWDTLYWDSTNFVLDGSNRAIEYGSYNWDNTSKTFIHTNKYVVTAFGSGNTPSALLMLDWNGTGYDTIMRATNILQQDYTGNDFLSSDPTDYELEQYMAGSWVKVEKQVSVFSNGKINAAYSFDWTGSNWDSTRKEEYTYDSHGNQTADIFYSINAPGSYTVNFGTRDSFIYSANGLIIDDYVTEYNSGDGTWNNTTWTHNYYNSTALGISPLLERITNVYPNPVSGNLNIDNKEGNTLRIIDLQGKVLYNTVLTDKHTQLDMSGLSKGVLMLQFFQPNGKVTVEKVINQ